MKKVTITLEQFGEIEVNPMILDPNYRENYGLNKIPSRGETKQKYWESEDEKPKDNILDKPKKGDDNFNGWY